MDRHVTCWHQMVSRYSYGSEILISCQPLEEKVKSIGSARTGLAYWCKWKLEYQIERSELERFLQGDFEFCSQVHRACSPIGFEKGNQVKVTDAAVDVPTVSYDFVGCPMDHRADCAFVPRGFHILGRRCSTVRFYGRILGVFGIRVLDMRGWKEISRY